MSLNIRSQSAGLLFWHVFSDVRKVEKVAVVGSDRPEKSWAKIADPFIRAEIKYFPESERKIAEVWIQEWQLQQSVNILSCWTGSCRLQLFGYPEFNDRLPGYSKPGGFLVQPVDHPLRKIYAHAPGWYAWAPQVHFQNSGVRLCFRLYRKGLEIDSRKFRIWFTQREIVFKKICQAVDRQ